MKLHHTSYQLLVGGDWACAHGDAGGLCHVARQLAARVPGSMRSVLKALSTTDADPFESWASVRPALVECLRDAGDVDHDRASQHC